MCRCFMGGNHRLRADTSVGGMRERPNRHAWSACVGQPTQGSNPCPSAQPRYGNARLGYAKYMPKAAAAWLIGAGASFVSRDVA
jgi:hypothetical protein